VFSRTDHAWRSIVTNLLSSILETYLLRPTCLHLPAAASPASNHGSHHCLLLSPGAKNTCPGAKASNEVLPFPKSSHMGLTTTVRFSIKYTIEVYDCDVMYCNVKCYICNKETNAKDCFDRLLLTLTSSPYATRFHVQLLHAIIAHETMSL